MSDDEAFGSDSSDDDYEPIGNLVYVSNVA